MRTVDVAARAAKRTALMDDSRALLRVEAVEEGLGGGEGSDWHAS